MGKARVAWNVAWLAVFFSPLGAFELGVDAWGGAFATNGMHGAWAGLLTLGGGVYLMGLAGPALSGLGALVAAPLFAAQAELWAAPLHVGVAVGSWAAAVWATTGKRSAALGPAAVGLAVLGVDWNYLQGGGAGGWAWDWIEAGPVAAGGAGLALAHAWGRQARLRPLLLFAAALAAGRSALTLSLHHAAAPIAAYRPWPVRGHALAGTAGSRGSGCAGAASLALCAGVGCRGGRAALQPRSRASGGCSRPQLPYRLHAVAGLGWTVLGVTCTYAGTAAAGGGGYSGVATGPRAGRYAPAGHRMHTAFRGLTFAGGWMRGLVASAPAQGLFWGAARINRHSLSSILRYAAQVVVPPFRPTSVFGFALLVGIYIQMYSGLLLALYYLPDPSFTIAIREDLMLEVWWFLYVYKAHVIGVDMLFVLSYLHILKKLYLRNYAEGDLDGWFTGAYAFLIYHVVVFLGITLSTNHLGDVTIMIAANIYWSLFFRWHKVYAPFFSNKHLSTDQLTRFMLAHYLSAWYYTYLVQTHVLFVHEMWDADANRSTQQTTGTPKSTWLWDALKKEGLTMISLYLALAIVFFLMAHPDARVVNYSFFEQWSETEMEEVNFFIVAPHWYFRPHMGLLTVCAHHYEGLAWLVGFYLLLCYTPHLYRFWGRSAAAVARPESAPMRQSPSQELLYFGFVASILYVGGTLPCGRFYYENVDGFFGNSFLRLSYEYLYLYLGLLAHTADRLERLYCSGAAWRRHLARLARRERIEPIFTAEGAIHRARFRDEAGSEDEDDELTPPSASELDAHLKTYSFTVTAEEAEEEAREAAAAAWLEGDVEDEDLYPAPTTAWGRIQVRGARWGARQGRRLRRAYHQSLPVVAHLLSREAWATTWRFAQAHPRALLWEGGVTTPAGVSLHLDALLVGLFIVVAALWGLLWW